MCSLRDAVLMRVCSRLGERVRTLPFVFFYTNSFLDTPHENEAQGEEEQADSHNGRTRNFLTRNAIEWASCTLKVAALCAHGFATLVFYSRGITQEVERQRV